MPVSHDHPGRGALGADADRRRDGARPEALAQHRDVVDPVEQRHHEPRRAADPRQRGLQRGGLGGDHQHVDVVVQARGDRGRDDELAQADAGQPQAAPWRSPPPSPRARRPSWPRPHGPARRRGTRRRRRVRAPPRAPYGAEPTSGRPLVTPSTSSGSNASTSTPGLRIPAGSTAALAACSASANGSGRWRSYQGRWSRPTAWWWVIVAPCAHEHLRGGPLDRPPLRLLVAAAGGGQHREVRRGAVGVGVRQAAGDQRALVVERRRARRPAPRRAARPAAPR